MSHRRTRGTGVAFEQSLRCGIVLAAGILIGSAFSVPSASAALLREAAGAVEPTLRSVHAVASTAPSLPSLAPPATPSAPAAPQLPVRLPTVPQLPVRLPTEGAPTPSSSHPSSGVDAPSVDEIAGAARNSIGSVTSAGEKTAKQATTSSGNDGGWASVLQSDSGAGAGKATSRPIDTASRAPLRIAPAEVAALQRWFARIWPAIALADGEAGRGWLARVIERGLLHPAVVAIARLLSLGPPAIREAGDSPLVGPPVPANAPQPALSNVPGPADGKSISYIVTFAALLALLAFTVWREFRSTLRTWMR
jgi:hypothetical protein